VSARAKSSRRVGRRLAALALLLGSLRAGAEEPRAAVAPVAAAASDDARRLFLAGRQAYQAGRLDVAAASFEAAYRIAPLPALLWNLAQTWRKRWAVDEDPAALERAIEDYRRYLKDAPDGPNRANAAEALAELLPVRARAQAGAHPTGAASPPPPQERTEVMVVTEAEGARVALDGAEPAPAPLLAAVAPGEHRARVEAPGWLPGEVRLRAFEGRLVTGEARLQPLPGRLEVAGQRGATLHVDGRAVGRLPLAPLELPAGAHALAVTARGRTPFARTVTVARGEPLRVAVDLAPTAQRRAARWLLVAAGVGALATFAAGMVALQADRAAASLNADRTAGSITPDQLGDYLGDRARRDAWVTGTWAAAGITVGLALVAGAMLVFDTPAAPRVADAP
jgi:tetratricopeptide (TPR) repeat protein